LNEGKLTNKVARYVLNNLSMALDRVVIDGIPGAGNHDGGRIKFGPDGKLYITTGDATVMQNAQDLASLSGKILRLNDDGSIPQDNPFTNSPVYSYGHRNPEGLAWDGQGRLWETEHGSSATDEINLIQAGGNYGWPVIRGDQTATGMIAPVVQSGNVTWAPSGAVILEHWLYFAGLNGQSLFRIDIDNPGQPERFFEQEFGRLRAVELGPDGRLYILTSNRDGRGSPTMDDDRIFSVDPASLSP
jgi:glucose/arabinose dehydrogenase